MARETADILKSGYLTADEKYAMDFELALEEHEKHMGEGAAMALTCEQFGIDYERHVDVLLCLPDGDWWEAEHLPVRAAA